MIHMTFRSIAAGLITIFGAVSCAPPENSLKALLDTSEVPGAPAGLTTIDPHVFAVGYDRLDKIYLNEIDLPSVVSDGINGLKRFDNSVALTYREGFVDLTYDEALVRSFPRARAHDADGWALLTANMVDDLRNRSGEIAEASDEAIYEVVFESVIGELDPYSRYSTPRESLRERARRDGYGGIGISYSTNDDGLVVRRVFARGPAADAGILEGEEIVAVNGQTVVEIGLDAIGDYLRGPSGSVVLVTVIDSEGGNRRTLRLVRDRIVPTTVIARRSDDIGVLSIDRFNVGTLREVRSAVRNLLREDPMLQGVVLDLRGNPGGLLDQAVNVADLFIADGEIIHTRGRHPRSVRAWNAETDDILGGRPLAVLIDGGSASAAEVLAAALQDNARAVVVGSVSFGKGSVQTVTELPNEGQLYLTWSRLYTPRGYTLHQQGVFPTVCTSQLWDEFDDGTISAVVRRVSTGSTPPPFEIGELRKRANQDLAAINQLRDACPARATLRDVEDLDLGVAMALLRDPNAYRRAHRSAAIFGLSGRG